MSQPVGTRRLWVGTYPVDGQGSPTGAGEGVWQVTLDPATGALSDSAQLVVTPAPSFLAAEVAGGGLLYAVNEATDGGLTVLRPGPDGLEILASASTHGAHPCHLHVDRRRGIVVVANYTSGSVSVFRLRPDGLPEHDSADQILRLTGSGPHPERQEAPHAHYVLPTTADGPLLATDLGTDRIHRFAVAGRRLVEDGIAVTLPPGSGPRHAVFSADGGRLFVAGELDGQLHVVDWDGRRAQGTVVRSTPADPEGEAIPQLAHLERAGAELYLGCRGTNRVAVHRVGEAGTTRFERAVRLPGAQPRHHAVVDGWLVVAQQERGGVVVLDRSGTVRGTADIPSPACISPVPSG